MIANEVGVYQHTKGHRGEGSDKSITKQLFHKNIYRAYVFQNTYNIKLQFNQYIVLLSRCSPLSMAICVMQGTAQSALSSWAPS